VDDGGGDVHDSSDDVGDDGDAGDASDAGDVDDDDDDDAVDDAAPAPALRPRGDGAPVPSDSLSIAVPGLSAPIPRHLYNRAFDAGLLFCHDKSPVWWPAAPTAAVREAYDRVGIPQSYVRGTTVLKAPVGDEAYTQEVLDGVCRKATKSLDVLADMDDALIALALLRSCLGVCRVTYSL
jgi:hypothetical protein